MLNRPDEPACCECCARPIKPLTMHHLIPRSQHKRKSIRKLFDRAERLTQIMWVCRPCHNMIHLSHSELELARYFNTIEKLLADPFMQKYIFWIKDKPADFMPRTRRT